LKIENDPAPTPSRLRLLTFGGVRAAEHEIRLNSSNECSRGDERQQGVEGRGKWSVVGQVGRGSVDVGQGWVDIGGIWVGARDGIEEGRALE
jgi:hypothetical protein